MLNKFKYYEHFYRIKLNCLKGDRDMKFVSD